jgi:hypothetical protein
VLGNKNVIPDTYSFGVVCLKLGVRPMFPRPNGIFQTAYDGVLTSIHYYVIAPGLFRRKRNHDVKHVMSA